MVWFQNTSRKLNARVASNMFTSTCWPRPVRPRATSAARVALAAVMAVTLSTITFLTMVPPWDVTTPASAWTMGSYTGWPA